MKAFIVLATVFASVYAKPGLVGYNAGFPFTFGAGYPYTATSYYQQAAPAISYASYPAFQYAAAPAPAIQYTAAPAIQYAAAPALIAPAFTKTQYHAQTELGEASYGYAHPGQAHSAVRDAFGNVRGSYAYIDPTGKEVRTNYVADAINGFSVESNNLPVAPVHVLPPAPELPVPVSETPEVAQARAEHLQAVEEAKLRNAAADSVVEVRAERKKRGIYSTYASAPALSYATTYQYPAVAYSSSYRYDAPAVKTIAVAPLKTIAYAPAPLKTIAYAPAPLKTIAYAPAPLKTIAYAPAPLKTIAYAPAPLKTFAYAPATYKTFAAPLSTYGYSAYAPALAPYNYGYSYGYSPLAYRNFGYSKILYWTNNGIH